MDSKFHYLTRDSNPITNQLFRDNVEQSITDSTKVIEVARHVRKSRDYRPRNSQYSSTEGSGNFHNHLSMVASLVFRRVDLTGVSTDVVTILDKGDSPTDSSTTVTATQNKNTPLGAPSTGAGEFQIKEMSNNSKSSTDFPLGG